MSLTTTIKSIQDIMRQDAGVDGDAQRISQLVWMLFLKMFDANEELYEWEAGYVSPIPEPLRWRNWAADDEGRTGDELLAFINNTLFPALKGLAFDRDGDPRGYVVQEVFADSFNYMKNGTLMRQVINRINTIDFHSGADRHVFNDIYEKILRDLQSAGNAGEYYTPRAVTQFMTDMTAPRPTDRVLDPACGTGGFLVGALQAMRAAAPDAEARLAIERRVQGIEKKPLPHMLAVTNLFLHGVMVPNVARDNALTRRPYRGYGDAERVDVVLTNPPFGGVEEPGVESGFPAAFQTKETADLFLALIIHILKDGGRAAIVLPDGSLFGEGVKTRIKERLLETCDLHTIVRLPNGVFNPYTGIRTNLLFFTKGQPTREVWYYEHQLPPGYKQYTKTRPITIAEFDAEKGWWGAREATPFAWRVGRDEIVARNYNLDIKNPHAPDGDAADPAALLAEWQAAEAEAAAARTSLRDALAAALRATGVFDGD